MEIQPLSNVGRWVNASLTFLGGRSATEGLFQSPPLAAAIRRWAAETPFDSAFVFCSSMYQFTNCPELKKVPLVVDLVDVDSEKWLNYAGNASLWKQPLYRLEAKRVRHLEQAIAQAAKAVTLVSEDEVKVFRKFCDAENVSVVGNGVDLDYFHPAPAEYHRPQESPTACKPFKLVFVGVLDYRANITGLRWFCQEVWPKLREKIPGIELDLVGRRPGDAVRKLANRPGINLIGEVDDVRPYVWNADVAIAPLTVARGIQNKILEAMAMAKPVVATPQAVAGTGAIPGEHLVSAADPQQWSVDLEYLCCHSQAREKLAHSGRAYLEDTMRWFRRLEPLGNLLALTTAPQSSPAPEVSLTP